MKIIDVDTLNSWLKNHPQWQYQASEIVFEKDFGNFVNAFGFLSRLAMVMEKHDHHPIIMNTYGHVRLSLTTHDAENKITDRDLNLAEKIEELL